MFCALCLKKSKELKSMDQQHIDILAKIGVAIALNCSEKCICTVCEEDIKKRQDNLALQTESNQLNEFLTELKENICQSPTKSSSNMLLMQTEESKQLNELLSEIQGNLCKSPRKYIGGNHEQKIKIEKIEIDDTEEFLLEQEQQYVEVEENPTANDAHIICKKVYAIDNDCAAMETEDVPSQEIVEKAQFSLSKCTFSNQPFKLSAFGAKFPSDTSESENEFEDNEDGLMPSPSAVYSNVERNGMLTSSFTANSNELQNSTILQTKSINLSSAVELLPNADSMAPSKTKQTIANFAQQDKSSTVEDGLPNVSAQFLQNAEKSNLAASKSNQNNGQKDKSSKAASKSNQTINKATEQSTITTLRPNNSSKFSKNSQNFKRHIQKVGKTFRCKLCSKSKKFSKISDIKEHIEFEHLDLGYHLCTECDRIFETESRLEEHYKRRHNNMKQPLKLKTAVHEKADRKITKQNHQHRQISDDVAAEVNQDKQQENTIPISDNTTIENNISSSSTVNSHQTQNNTSTSTSPQNNSSQSILKIKVKQLSLDAWLKTTNKAEQQKSTGLKETRSSKTVKNTKRPRSPDRTNFISSQPSAVKPKEILNKKNTNSIQSSSAEDQMDSISSQSNTTDANSPPQLSLTSNEKAKELNPTFENDKFRFKNKYKKVGNLYCCASCSHKSKAHEALFAHIKSQHYGYRYFCNYCNDNFVNKWSVERHCKSMHNKEHSDPIDFRIPKPEELKEQFNFDDKIKKVNNFYICTECSQQYKLSASLRDHIKTKHYGYRYFCNYCDAQCTQKIHLQTHCRGVHKKEYIGPIIFRIPKPEELPKPPQFSFDNKIKKIDNFYVCTECSQKYPKQQPLRDHIKSKHYGYRYFCHYCDMHCAQKAAVERHCQRAHKKQHSDPIIYRIPKSEELKEPEEINFDNAWKKINNYYVCSLCPAESAMKATTTSNLRLHIKIHHYNYRYYCSECNANYLTSSALKPHYKKQHNISDGIIKCQKPKSTDTPITLRTKTYKPMKHYDYTNKYKKVGNHYICTVCKNSKKKYTDAPHIRQHIKFDHYGYKYICKKCNMSWYGINGIKSHNLKVHNVKDGPLIFARTKQPQRYTKTKIDFANTYKKNAEKSYDCLLCNSAPFTAAATVARHIKVEHYGYRYKCAKCPVQLFSRVPLEIHYRRAHRIKSGSIIFERVSSKATHKIKFKD